MTDQPYEFCAPSCARCQPHAAEDICTCGAVARNRARVNAPVDQVPPADWAGIRKRWTGPGDWLTYALYASSPISAPELGAIAKADVAALLAETERLREALRGSCLNERMIRGRAEPCECCAARALRASEDRPLIRPTLPCPICGGQMAHYPTCGALRASEETNAKAE